LAARRFAILGRLSYFVQQAGVQVGASSGQQPGPHAAEPIEARAEAAIRNARARVPRVFFIFILLFR
jgi:hypothetical protein